MDKQKQKDTYVYWQTNRDMDKEINRSRYWYWQTVRDMDIEKQTSRQIQVLVDRHMDRWIEESRRVDLGTCLRVDIWKKRLDLVNIDPGRPVEGKCKPFSISLLTNDMKQLDRLFVFCENGKIGFQHERRRRRWKCNFLTKASNFQRNQQEHESFKGTL